MGDVIPFRKKSETGDQPERIKQSLNRINDLLGKLKEASATFAETEERNRQNEERLKRERLKANKDVLRSYRIKGPE